MALRSETLWLSSPATALAACCSAGDCDGLGVATGVAGGAGVVVAAAGPVLADRDVVGNCDESATFLAFDGEWLNGCATRM
jgi:hypothetical protein